MWSILRSKDLKKRFVVLTDLVAGEVYEIRLSGYEGPNNSYPKVVTQIKRIRMGAKTGYLIYDKYLYSFLYKYNIYIFQKWKFIYFSNHAIYSIEIKIVKIYILYYIMY